MAPPALLLPVAAALLALAAAWLWDYAVVRLLWRPHAVAAALGARGVRGPPYRYLSGCNGDIRRMKAEADGVALDDVRDHDYLRRVVPHFLAWKDQYGKKFYGDGPRSALGEDPARMNAVWASQGFDGSLVSFLAGTTARLGLQATRNSVARLAGRRGQSTTSAAPPAAAPGHHGRSSRSTKRPPRSTPRTRRRAFTVSVRMPRDQRPARQRR